MSEYKLTKEILERSQSKIWDIARFEWKLEEIYMEDEPETCLCGHFPITEICILRNKFTAQRAVIGNCCVKKFMGLSSDLILKAVKRIKKDCRKSLNAEAIQYTYEKDWINNWEYNFLIDTMRKRCPTDKQLLTRMKINEKILEKLK